MHFGELKRSEEHIYQIRRFAPLHLADNVMLVVIFGQGNQCATRITAQQILTQKIPSCDSLCLSQGEDAKAASEARSKINIFENAFRKIKEATGVSDVNEVIQKITSQEGTTENLLSLTKENAQVRY